eukprot:2396408-Rhodomonas_salina.2
MRPNALMPCREQQRQCASRRVRRGSAKDPVQNAERGGEWWAMELALAPSFSSRSLISALSSLRTALCAVRVPLASPPRSVLLPAPARLCPLTCSLSFPSLSLSLLALLPLPPSLSPLPALHERH